MKIAETQYIAEIKIKDGQSARQLDSELSEFDGMVLATCKNKLGLIAACGFSSAKSAADYLQSLLR